MSLARVDGVQNVEVSIKLPCEKTLQEQLLIMEKYTQVHKESSNLSKERREINCLKVIYPEMFRSIQETDRIAGRLDVLPIGFGCVTSLGGVGHYCVFNKLREFQQQLPNELERNRVQKLYDYWLNHDVKAIYCDKMLDDVHSGRFVDCQHPFLSTARLSGMMLDYHKLMDLGLSGLKQLIDEQLKTDSNNEFLLAAIEALKICQDTIEYLKVDCEVQLHFSNSKRKKELNQIITSLANIKEKAPKSFHEALQLFWIYAHLAGCINYGRLDDVLGPFLKHDVDNGILLESEAIDILKSLWLMIENRRTTVNGRIIVGGRGRRHPTAADYFTKLALKVTYECRYVEPQFTLRFDKNTAAEIMDMAYDCLGAKATYPTLYNDDVNIPAVMYGMRVDEKTAEQYVPFGCGEFVIQGQSVGTPNTLLNLLKLLNITLHEGIDPVDNRYKAGSVILPKMADITSFEMFHQAYKDLLNFYFDLSIEHQYASYEIMNQEVSFIFASILMDDCLSRKKALLDGGVRYLGGTNETYGNINTSDALFAIRKLVFEDKKYTLPQLIKAQDADFEGYYLLQNDLLNCHKYGNDYADVDEMANDLYEFVAKGIRDRGIEKGMQYYLIVISNNQTNTDWGKCTAASLDGRRAFTYLNPANNPVGGASKLGPTAMLNSLVRFDAKYHGGSVQNIKFTPNMFNGKREIVKQLFTTYFEKGGCHLMVTVVDHKELEDAQLHPEKYPNLIVRVSGFSAVFVNLDKEVQDELISRVLYDA